MPPGPPPLPTAPVKGSPLVLSVSRRMLWVGSAAIPLHNITWVDAYRMKPDRVSAAARLLAWLVGAVLVYLLGNSATDGDAGGNGNLWILVVAAGLAVGLKGLFVSAQPVLAVEMASGSKAIVTLPSMDELRHIAGRIAHAIDHPEAEFTTLVQQYNNTNNYGPVVSMRDGRGNTGFKL
ncbi:DUF6232 family protein [Streptomyces sp. NPDC005930]|uniref:DUF6232 family protein n=1 Tax=Streptomyces sp. NPDC005930 TaxID=3364736 RepID=UPI00367BE134